MKSLITGAAGFIGGFLAEKLIERGDEVYGAIRAGEPTTYLSHKLNIIFCDITKYAEVENMLAKIKPDEIYHLAAQSVPTISCEKPRETLDTNVCGAINIFEALIKKAPNSKILVTGTSGEYGLTFVLPKYQKMPPKEDAPLNPVHPYGISKLAQEKLATNYYCPTYKIKAIMPRLFNTIGPRKENDMPSDIAKQIVKIERGEQEPVLRVGNLASKRAYADVRDVVTALTLLVEKGTFGEVYNICATKNVWSTQNILDTFSSKTSAKFEIKVVDHLKRPYDEPIIWGDSSKLVRATGWKPKIPIDKTIEDILEFWRTK